MNCSEVKIVQGLIKERDKYKETLEDLRELLRVHNFLPPEKMNYLKKVVNQGLLGD